MTITAPPSWMIWSRDEVRTALAATDLVVLYGGTSPEREVSLASGRHLMGALAEGEDGLPRSVRGVEIDAQGFWWVDGEALAPDDALRQLPAGSLFFNALHGGVGENGVLQDYLGSHGRRYTGSGVQASSLCMDKARTRLLMRKACIETAPGRLVRRAEWGTQMRRVLVELSSLPGLEGWFVKPNQGGSSVGVRHVREVTDLQESIEKIFEKSDEALVESCISGVEATVGVIGLPSTGLVSLPVVEIVPREDGWFDYQQKYDDDGASEQCPPVSIPPEVCMRLGDLGRQAFEAAGCEGYARVDFMLPPAPLGSESSFGEPVVLEINTLPGLGPRGLLPQSVAVAGGDMRCLVLEIAAMGLLRRGPS